jgi:hypothetical protein
VAKNASQQTARLFDQPVGGGEQPSKAHLKSGRPFVTLWRPITVTAAR